MGVTHISGPFHVAGVEIVDVDGNLVAPVEIGDLEEIVDASGNELLEFDSVASAVNFVGIANSATGNNPLIYLGGEVDTGLTFMNDQAEEMLILDSIASAVNNLQIANSATGVSPILSTVGGDANISMRLEPKGTGEVEQYSDEAGALGSVLVLRQDSATPAAADVVGRVRFDGEDSVSAQTVYGQIDSVIRDTTNASEDGDLEFLAMRAGTLTKHLAIDSDVNGIVVGDGVTNGTVQSSGNFDLILRTGNATTGSIGIEDGASGAITLAPDATGVTQVLSSSAAAVGAVFELYQNSASPAAADVVGRLSYQGEDSISAKTEYAKIEGVIVDATDTTEDAALKLFTMVAGTLTEMIDVRAAGVKLTQTSPLLDANDNELFKFVAVGAAVNEITLTNAATGTDPLFSATGGDANIGIFLRPKATGAVTVDSTDAGALGSQLTLRHAGGSQANADVVGRILFNGQDSVAALESYGRIDVIVDDITAASPDSDMSFLIDEAGVLVERLRLLQDINGVQIGDGGGDVTLTSSGNTDIIIQTGNPSTGTITIEDGAGGNIRMIPNTTGAVTVESNDVGAVGASFTLRHNGGSQANSDVVGRVLVNGQDDAAALESYSRIDTVVTDVAAASPDSDLIFYVDVAGTLTEKLRLASTVAGISVGTGGAAGVLQSSGSNDLTVQTGNATTGKITIVNGAAGKISIAPNAAGVVELLNQDAGALGSVLVLNHLGGSQANSDVVSRLRFDGQDDAVAAEIYGRIDVIAKDVAAASPDAIMAFYVDVAGTVTEKMRIDADLNGLQIGDGAANATLRSNGNFDLKLETGNATTGTITIIDGVAGAINIAPDTTGQVTTTRIQASIGVQTTPTARTSTVDGLTTGIIAAGTGTVTVTSADANNIITLPTAVVGDKITIFTPATGCELRTPAAGNATINNVDSDGTNELALVASAVFQCTCRAADTWIVIGWNNLGAALAALVPDAA